MSTWTDYWRLVTPRTQKQNYTVTDTIQMHNDAGHPAFTSYSWYSQLMKGAGSRLTKYLQYDGMDADIDVSRAIDIIAEEMATVDEKSNLPFEIEYQNEPGQQISENMVTTIRAACRHWANFQDFENRVFRIARTTVKYGDCFFRKSTDLKRWEYLDPANILGIELNDNGEKVAFHIKRSNLAATVSSSTPLNDIVPASAVIHFTLCDDMGPVMPFGESILEPIKKTFKQLGLLEDACIIYRIVRAPERRVFYIDVGNMPAMKVKQYLNQVRLDMRQKRTPNTTGGGETVDSVLDPFSTQEDFFFPVTTSGRGSRVETLPGGENLGDLPEVKYFQAKIFRGLRIPMSYLSQAADGGATVQDGKMGVAYIEELRFANYVRRLQNKIEKVFDEQFKLYLLSTGIKVDDYLFKIKLPEPQNFALYRQAALDGDLINTFQSAEGIKFLSKRYIMKRYLGMSEDDIQSNEVLLKQERGILDDAAYSDIRQIYDPKIFESWPELDLKDVAQGPAQSAEDMNVGGEGGGEGGEEDTGGGEPSGGGPGDLGIEPEETP